MKANRLLNNIELSGPKSIFRRDSFIFILLSLCLCIYLWLRAYYVPMVHDEIVTFYHYIHSANFIPYSAHWDANNHILNSFLSYISYRIFGANELSLRLPNLLAAFLYLFFCYKLSQEIKDRKMRWLFIISLCFVHNFMEFFALNRGYGLSMALLIASVWHVKMFVKRRRIKYAVFSIIFIDLAFIANLTLIVSALILSSIASIDPL